MESRIIDICICVATYQRPYLLKELLKSIVALETSDRFSYEIIVVDNDQSGSAAPVVGMFQKAPISISYLIEPQQNISLARNKAINYTNAAMIAFIDDDETAEAKWLLNLFNAIRQYNTDAVIGKVVSIFPLNTPEIIRRSRPFCLPNPSSGSTTDFVLATNNCLIKRSVLCNEKEPFDPEFGLSGGEDSDFFNTIKMMGASICYCREAIVYESVPKNRANTKWLLKRFFRNGLVTFGIMKKNLSKSTKNSLGEKRKLYLKRLMVKIKTLIFLKINFWLRISSQEDIANTEQDIAFCLGFIYRSLGFKYRFYKSN